MADSIYIEPKTNYTLFRTEEERVAFLQRYGLLGVSGKKRKPFLYKGIATDRPIPCEIIGYQTVYNFPADGEDDHWATLVISVGDEKLFVHSAYLKEMQDASFVRNAEEP